MSTVQDSAFGGERVTILKPRRGWAPLDLRERFDYRELLFFLVWRDVKIRYKQTALGVAWAVLQPLLTMLIFTVVAFAWLEWIRRRTLDEFPDEPPVRLTRPRPPSRTQPEVT